MRGEIYIPVLIGLYKCNYYLIFRRVTVLLTPQTLVIMFVILSKESFKKKAVCYSIKQRSKLGLLQKEANTTMQWSHVKTFKFVFYCFYCLTSIFVLFCFCEINFDVFTIFLSVLIKKKMYFSWKYIYQWKGETFL